MNYKDDIEVALKKIDFEIVKIGHNKYWWDDEHWKVVFKYDRNSFFFITFVVDPEFKKPRKKGDQIYEVKASRMFPTDWNDNSTTIASIQMSTRKFNIKLKKFSTDINKFKQGSRVERELPNR